MTANILQHSDQIVNTIAKLPLSVFGTFRTKEVMLVLANHMNKDEDWTAWPSVPTIAEIVGCCVRTVRYSLRRLEGINFIDTEEDFRKDDPRMNTANKYKLGSALRTLCEQLCRPPCRGLHPNKLHLNKKIKDKDTPPKSAEKLAPRKDTDKARKKHFALKDRERKQKGQPRPSRAKSKVDRSRTPENLTAQLQASISTAAIEHARHITKMNSWRAVQP